MKLVESKIKVKAGFHDRARKRSAEYKRNKLLAKKAALNIGDGLERVLKTGPLDLSSVLAVSDLDPFAFGMTTDGKITVEGGGNKPTVTEQHLESELIDVNIRKLDDTICYTVDGKGNSVPGGRSLEFAAGSIEKDLCPYGPIVVELRTTQAAAPDEIGMTSKAFAEIRPNGSIEVFCENGYMLTEDIPMTAAAIQYDQDVKKKTWDTPHLKIEAHLDKPLIQYAVTGKGTGPLAVGDYVELDADSLGADYTPLATGPNIILRTDGDECNASVKIGKDGSVILSVYVADTILDDSTPVTATYLNTVEENVLTCQIADVYRDIYIRKQDDLLIVQYQQKTSESLTAGQFKPVWTGSALIGYEEFLPDEAVLIDVEGSEDIGFFLDKTGGYLANFKGSNNTANSSIHAPSVPHLDLSDDVIEQALECPHAEISMRAGDNQEIVYEVVTKGTTPPSGEITLFPAGTVDPEFTPSDIDGFVAVPLTPDRSIADKEKKSFLKIFADGLISLVSAGIKLAAGNESKNAILYEDPEDQEVIGHKLVGEQISLDVHQDGDLNVYSAEALTSTITAGQEFEPGTIKPEYCPPEDVTIEIPCARGSGAKHTYVTVHMDGSASVTAGQVLQEGADAMACGFSIGAAAMQVEKKLGVHIEAIARKSDGIITYTLNVKNKNVPAGTTDELGSNPFGPDFRPDHDTLVEVITEGQEGDTAYALVKPDGSIQLTSDGTPLSLTYSNQAVSIYDPVPATQDVDEQQYTSGGFELNIRKLGSMTTYEAGGDGSTSYSAGETQVFAPGTLATEYLPEEPIVLNLRTGSNGLSGNAFLLLSPDGSGVITCPEATVVSPLSTNTCRCLLWHDELQEQEIDLTSVATREMMKSGYGAFTGNLALLIRKTKEAISARLSGHGHVTTDFSTVANTISEAFKPDKLVTVHLTDMHSGSTTLPQGGSLDITPDGKVEFRFLTGGIDFVGGRPFMCQYMQYGDGDIFTNMHSVLRERGELPVHSLELHNMDLDHTSGRMLYHTEYLHPEYGRTIVTLQTNRRLLVEYGYGDNWFTSLCSKAWSFVKTNVDFKAIGTSLWQAGASIVTGLISGKGLGQSVKGAFQEVAAGGISKYLRPDGPVGCAISTIGGATEACMKILPSGACTLITKAKNTVANTPVGMTFINVWKGSRAVNGSEYPTYLKNEYPRNYQLVDELISVEAIRTGMSVVYHICGKQIEIEKGVYALKGVLKESLRPDHDLLINIGLGESVVIHRNGTIELSVVRSTTLSALVIPAMTILMPKVIPFITHQSLALVDIKDGEVIEIKKEEPKTKITRRSGKNKLKKTK